MLGFGCMHLEIAATLDVFQYSMHVLREVYTPILPDNYHGTSKLFGFFCENGLRLPHRNDAKIVTSGHFGL